MEWSEITARLNAARDFRQLLRHESQGNIEAVAASFGDAAARYFALLADGERDVNPDALGASKAFSGIVSAGDASRTDVDAQAAAHPVRGDARDEE